MTGSKVTILRQSTNRVGWHCPKGLTLDLDAGALSLAVGEALAAHFRACAEEGVSPSDGTPHPPLQADKTQGKRVRAGLRRDVRGASGRRGRNFAQSIQVRRFKPRKSVTKAQTAITFAANPEWIREELARGVNFVDTTGLSQDVADEAAREWLKTVRVSK